MNCNKSVYPGLVAVEGIDGSGTTTLVEGIKKIFIKYDIELYTGFEPTNGPIGQLIRSVLSGSIHLRPKSLAMLFAADRYEHLYGRGGIVSLIGNGGIYITDRSLFSSLAYQSQEVDFEQVQALNAEFPLPELLIFLDLPVETALQRLTERTSTTREIYENKKNLINVSNSYRKIISMFENGEMKILRLNACLPPEELVESAFEFIKNSRQFVRHRVSRKNNSTQLSGS